MFLGYKLNEVSVYNILDTLMTNQNDTRTPLDFHSHGVSFQLNNSVMRIFDPKDQLGNSLLSQADTQKSSVKLEKQMAVGGGAITLTSEDISDIENWELSNASVEDNGQTFSFLPESVRNADGSLTINFGTVFSKAVLVLKRTDFDGMRHEEEQVTIEVKIQQLMAKTLIDSKKQGYDASANIAQWKALGKEANRTDPVKYENATLETLGGYEISGTGEVVVDDYFLSVDTLSDPDAGGIVVADTVTGIKWHADLPCLQETTSGEMPQCITEWTGRIPNVTNAYGMFFNSDLTEWTVELPDSITNASCMFQGCTRLTEWTVELPNSLTDASCMFQGCTRLTEWNVALPNSLIYAQFMFWDCSGLKEWNVALPNSLIHAQSMFDGCNSLTSFTSDMPTSLTKNAQSMFEGCKLDITSVERISRTIAVCTGTYDYEKTIHLGVSSECHGDTNYDTYINRMKGKGWIVVCTVNNSSHTH